MRKNNQADIAIAVNNATYVDYLNRLEMLARSIFSWKNLDKIAGFGAERFLEKRLYDFGRCCIVNDPELGIKVFNVNPTNKLNNYDLPTEVMATSVTGYNKKWDFDDIVYVMNNVLQKPTAETVQLMAYRLYETERTIDINLNAQKTPILIEGDTKSIMTLKQVYEQYTGNIPFIFGNKTFDIASKLNSIKTDAPYIVDKLTEHKKQLMSEFMNFVGIDNFFSDKKERLITAEAQGTAELTNFYLNTFFKTRLEACELLNEKFLKDSEDKVEITINKDEIMKLKGLVDDMLQSNQPIVATEKEALNG